MSIHAQCPNCGAPIAFQVDSSIVTVCDSCSTVVARTDRAFEDLGKISDLVQTRSPLSLWMSGTFEGVGFQLTGRVQIQHGAGGVWDEWYMAFDDGRWGWLAEAQGRFYLTFRHNGPAVATEKLQPGVKVSVGDPAMAMTVAETGEATLSAGRGEIPYRLEPGRRYPYADLSGAGGTFGTIDFSENPPAVFIGRQVSIAELGLIGSGSEPDHDFAAMASGGVAAQAVSCDNCGGSLELHAPDRTERVACPYCGAMHDCNHGVLKFLKMADGGKVRPAIPLGSKGMFEEHEFTLIGFMRRKTSADWETYRWEEYLLYHPNLGFRWLVVSDGHWNYIKPVSLGDIRARLPDDYHYSGEKAEYDGASFKIFQAGEAEVEYVAGEFYWRVEAGQETSTVDYVKPPLMLSGESGHGELNWSLATYMTLGELKACFAGVEVDAPAPITIAPNQPFRHKAVYPIWGIFLVLALAMFVWGQSRQLGKQVHSQVFEMKSQKTGDGLSFSMPMGEIDLFFSEEFKLVGKQNVEIQGYCPQVDNSWVYAEVDLYNKETGAVYYFALPIEYYHGVTDGESWSEGGRSTTKSISAVPPGTYVLRLQVQRHDYSRSATLMVKVKQGVFQYMSWFALLIAISFIPICIIIYHFMFERRRWAQSDYGGGGDDDE